MAVFLDTDYNGRLWGKHRLVPAGDADQARIEAGKAWLDAEELAFLVETKGKVHTVHFGARERPWRAEFLPRALRFEKGRDLPDYVHSYPGGNNTYGHSSLVSPRLKALIEGRGGDADGWQFFPVDILHKDGTEFGTYHAWYVHRVRDAIDESSKGVKTVSGPADGSHSWHYSGELRPDRLKLRKPVIGDLNAWIDNRFFPFAGIFVSDALFQAMKDAGLTGFSAQSVWSEGPGRARGDGM